MTSHTHKFVRKHILCVCKAVCLLFSGCGNGGASMLSFSCVAEDEEKESEVEKESEEKKWSF